MIDKEIGRRLRSIAAGKRMYQTELAARMGMSYWKLNRALNGQRPIYAQEVPRFAEALGVDVKAILGEAE
jgi:transcriptional regulator with XRE-family HTH domain